jgi:PAS domain S-box-containing protein
MPQQPVTRTPSSVLTLDARSPLMTTADQLNLAIAVWDLQNMEVQFSPALAHLYGFHGRSFRGRYEDFLSHVHPADRRSVQDVIRFAIDLAQPFEVDYRILNSAGEVVWISSKAQISSSWRGGKPELIEVIQDVTPRYQARKALAENNTQWDALLKKSEELLFQLDPEAYFVWVSPSCQHILGYPSDELVGENLLNLVQDEELQKVILAFKALQERSLPQSFQHHLRLSSGQYLPVQSMLRQGDDLGTFAVLSCREITARVNLQSVLDCMHAAYSAIADTSVDLVYRFLPNGTLTFANSVFLESFDLPGEAIVGISLSDFLSNEECDRLQQICARLTPERAIASFQWQIKTRDGDRLQRRDLQRRDLQRRDLQRRDLQRRDLQRGYCQALFDSDGVLLEYQVIGQE